MKGIKIIFIAMEVSMLLGVVMLSFMTDWKEHMETESSWMFHTLIVLMALLAVVFQKEQQSIEWDEEDE